MAQGPVGAQAEGGDRAGPPPRIGGYAVERQLGAGGMGTVYLARSRGGRAVAVKVARPELAADAHFRERFRAEVAAARSVGGFHTAQVVDADPEAAAPWLATAYIPGPTLSRLLENEGPRDEDGLKRLGAALAEALAAIHRCGLVHRDLKPGNIIMAADGPRVVDFGIARALESTRLTATGTAFGTPGFLAPEQALGQAVDGAADVFALGAVLVAAAGGSAFGGGTPMGLMYRSVHEAPDLTAVPEALRTVVRSCLAKNPEDRPTPSRLLDLFVPEDGPGTPAPVPPPPTVLDTPQPPAFLPPPPAYAPAVGFHQAPTEYAALPDDVSFTAVSGQGAVLIDAGGVALGSDAGNVDFPWSVIARVDYAPEPPKQLRIAVLLHNGSVHQCRITARRRSLLHQWLTEIPLVLTYYH
ncbi:serine/threonine-protein kinase [Streptomyces sp. NPDC050145]|uniref:serine/threonine-protein kinase n=1 Tax=Streptomyces sp. NPDC050145 TaxID=3365602 RepID=UPI003789B558